ncbi:hypothetical protein EZV62_006384 [Acer yangbiense]|uniref:TF-B3 domain-containing protein n=1 Tax=Acer yangbiense TaxID=1000413 RepID=A0A5C7I8R3_9ROSI|nr:hypothetical protein EZV62_006384 [Acer yangbiense]
MKLAGDLRSTAQLLHAIERRSTILRVGADRPTEQIAPPLAHINDADHFVDDERLIVLDLPHPIICTLYMPPTLQASKYSIASKPPSISKLLCISLRLLTMSLIFEIPKTLTKNDVEEKVGLPVKIMKHMGEHSVDLIVFDMWGQQWPLKYYTRPTGDRRIPVLRAGWLKYVKDKGVRPGDEFIFSGHQVAGADGVPEMRYMIQVKRQIMTLEGELVSVEVVKNLTPMTFRGEPMI